MNKFMNPRAAHGSRAIVNRLRLSSRTCSLLLMIALGLIHTPIPSAATARTTPRVSLSFYDSYDELRNPFPPGCSYTYPDRGQVRIGSSTLTCPQGTVKYEWEFPERIGPDGAQFTLKITAEAKEGQSIKGEMTTIGSAPFRESQTEVGFAAEAGGPGVSSKVETMALTIIPRPDYESEFTGYKIRCVGLFDMVFRYYVEKSASRGGGDSEYDTDRPGRDYRSLSLPEARPQLRQAECGSDPKRRAFTYV